jgi:hypothetical protein
MTGLGSVALPEEIFEEGALRLQINIDEVNELPFLFIERELGVIDLPPARRGPKDILKYAHDDA